MVYYQFLNFFSLEPDKVRIAYLTIWWFARRSYAYLSFRMHGVLLSILPVIWSIYKHDKDEHYMPSVSDEHN